MVQRGVLQRISKMMAYFSTKVVFIMGLCLLFTACFKPYTRFATANDVLVVKNKDKTAGQANEKKQEEDEKSPCENFENYAPNKMYPEHTPMRLLRLNFHFINRIDSSHNFKPEEGRAFVHELLDMANKKLETNAKMMLPNNNNTPVLPTRYQYVLSKNEAIPNDDGIYFHYNDTLNVCNKDDQRGKSVYSVFNNERFDRYGVRKGEVINVFLLEHPLDSIASDTYKASADGIGKSDWAKILGAYQHYQKWKKEDHKEPMTYNAKFFAGLLNHEIGHCLGLWHTWNGNDGCDDTPKNLNLWNAPKNSSTRNQLSNNVMDYNAYRSAFTPCQLARIHYRFASNDLFQRKKLIKKWCTYNPKATIVINEKEEVVWNSAKDIEGDIIIEKGASLKVLCTVAVPKNAKIVLKDDAKLIVDGGNITNVCDEKWLGVELIKTGWAKPKVILQNHGSLTEIIYDWQQNNIIKNEPNTLSCP